MRRMREAREAPQPPHTPQPRQSRPRRAGPPLPLGTSFPQNVNHVNEVPLPELCTLCHHDRAWHENARHQFTSADESPTLRAKNPKDRVPSKKDSNSPPASPPTIAQDQLPALRNQPPRDLALRLALLEAGALTVAQLSAAEAQLAAISGHDGGVVVASIPPRGSVDAE